MNEPRYLRAARVLMDIFTPAGVDGFLLGLCVSLGGGVILFLYLSGN